MANHPNRASSEPFTLTSWNGANPETVEPGADFFYFQTVAADGGWSRWEAVMGFGGTVTGRSFDQWRDLANCHVMWRVTDDQAERAVLLDKIAAKCCELERKGETASIWHATALVRGSPCNCGQCAGGGLNRGPHHGTGR